MCNNLNAMKPPNMLLLVLLAASLLRAASPEKLHWVRVEKGAALPQNATPGGTEILRQRSGVGQHRETGRQVRYICKAQYPAGKESYQIGKVVNHTCNFEYGNRPAYVSGAFWVLAGDGEWKKGSPNASVPSSTDTDGEELYVCRVHIVDKVKPGPGYNDYGWHPGKLRDDTCRAELGGSIRTSDNDYELLYQKH